MKNAIEMFVGLFMVVGFAAFVYLALQLGEVSFLTDSRTYVIEAEFDNVSGVKKGATVQVAGVVVGEVAEVRLGDNEAAILSLKIDKSLKLPIDSMASVKSQGIIGDKYIQLSPGGDEEVFAPGSIISDTESSLDIESLISKFAFGSAK
ncbi:outer membrane lipid asymmetry maintenance protein MlaD [Desulforhopalus sp. IMCC35007]|uniref:outer membrane lipid asymmetry maintenance protein MlaD n=1 Tax=Desulforhopalus sp. IMCC35007 TaxID=2569543 RepID=UPI0010AE502C|nr:outer membrane lipid asymmetry maintenance protein MlaD [Desulforhopalus sp. IMCC35007]TKB09100.1 outer membrane lipid asymmetry maintenance protein MlaD [Desulforhopalus sp. IMCC35007]